MIRTCFRERLSWVLCFLLVLATTPLDSDAAIVYQSAGGTSNYSGLGAPYGDEELQSLVAPIALYPDALIAQMLTAATFPDQIAVAAYWLQQNKSLAPTALMTAVNGQSWDPSVKALTQFPSVLNNMAQNLAWTSQLGEAYNTQSTEVMSAIQSLRAKAKAAGNLKSSTQMTVTQTTPDIIVLQPPNPGVIYLPEYNPAVVYGTPIQTPGYTAGGVAATAALSFGVGAAVGALASGGCCTWGYSSWTCDWFKGGVYYRSYPYYGNNAWRGAYYGGYDRYGNHTYNSSYDYSHPYTAYQSAAYHSDSTGSPTTGNTINRNASATAPRAAPAPSPWDRSSGGWPSSEDVRGWGQSDDHGDVSTAFSSWGPRGGSSSFGNGDWGDRVASARGWGSLGAGAPGGGWGGGLHSGSPR